MKYLFGPVPSRRLGVSLGVDLVFHKICSLNCIYCEAGRTTNLTLKQKEYIPINDVIQELEEYLSSHPELDFITFSGQGEPTLNSGLGQAIDFIKDNYPKYKVAVISNGTLFWDKNIRNRVLRADVILPSLDAAFEATFQKINRPEQTLKIDKIAQGLIQLRKEFRGKIYLEIFLAPGINDTQEELTGLRTRIQQIKPDLIQLNTLDRPGTDRSVNALDTEAMEEIKNFFEPLPVVIIARTKSRKQIKSFNKDITQQILETIRRRPCTDQDLSEILNLHPNELNKYISTLIENKEIIPDRQARGIFFKINQPD
jgi:wyosine [tRNA(Phe)-imidazoG37] synthetase (radical SAM superfamily)